MLGEQQKILLLSNKRILNPKKLKTNSQTQQLEESLLKVPT